MVLYEIHSNVASSDQGLQDYPELVDLADTLRAKGVETRLVRQVHQEQDEINLAQGQFGQGVRVRGTTTRSLRPEGHIRGCLAWARAAAGRYDRGMHLELQQVRASNGAPLVMELLARHEQIAFLSGIDGEQLARFTARPDLTLEAIPPPLARNRALLAEYTARRQRPAGFLSQLKPLADLGLLPEGPQRLLTETVEARGGSAVQRLGEAQAVNLGLLSEYAERYQSLFDQFFALLQQAEAGSDLPALFDLLTQGVPWEALRDALHDHVHEKWRERIEDRRMLANGLRIGLAHADEAGWQEFRLRFRSVVLASRLQRDPALYERAVLLQRPDPDELAVVSPLRQTTAGLQQALAAAVDALPEPVTPLPRPLKYLLFEALVMLTFEGQYQRPDRDERRLPPRVRTARRLLSPLRLAVYDLANLRKLNPKVPVRGIAGNLADKVPVTRRELETVVAGLTRAVFPYGRMADELAATLVARQRDEARRQRARAVQTYLTRGYPLLGLTNYVLGRASLDSVEWGALLAGAGGLGLPVLSARDQVRDQEALTRVQQGRQEHVEGYVMLLQREAQRLFPLEAHPGGLATAYRYVCELYVVRRIRRYVYQRLQTLHTLHGDGLFEVLYQHLARQGALRLSRHQFAGMLMRHRVFDKVRLREFGYSPEMPNGDERENPWLIPAERLPASAEEHPFASPRVEAAFTRAAETFQRRLAGHRSAAQKQAGQGKWNLAGVLADLARDEVYDLWRPEAREPLERTGSAALLWKAVQDSVQHNYTTVIGEGREPHEAVVLRLPGRLGHLAALKPEHTFAVNGTPRKFQLRPVPDAAPEDLDAASRVVAQALAAQVGPAAGRGPSRLGESLERLTAHWEAWDDLRQVAMLPLIDQMLRETLLRLVKASEPQPRDVIQYPPEAVLCAGVSSGDQAKFHRLVARPDRRDVYATISELAGWLARFSRLREEMEVYRGVLADILRVIDGFNFTVWDAPYLLQYRDALAGLDEALRLRPEQATREDLRDIETRARDISRMVREIHNEEQQVRPRDRWLNRTVTRLRAVRPQMGLTFVDRLWEGAEEMPEGAGEEAGRKEKEYQTFSQRVRNVVDIRDHLAGKQVFVISPAHTQRDITLRLVDGLFALKGLYTPILVDVTGCASFLEALQSRIPPQRLFRLGDL